jgi:hypothetical protein
MVQFFRQNFGEIITKSLEDEGQKLVREKD